MTICASASSKFLLLLLIPLFLSNADMMMPMLMVFNNTKAMSSPIFNCVTVNSEQQQRIVYKKFISSGLFRVSFSEWDRIEILMDFLFKHAAKIVLHECRS